LPALSLSRGNFYFLSFLLLVLLLPEGSCESGLRQEASVISGELEEPRGLAIILRQPATTLGVEIPEIALCQGVSLVGGELIKARGRAIVLR
jgi:hypothetical protein